MDTHLSASDAMRYTASCDFEQRVVPVQSRLLSSGSLKRELSPPWPGCGRRDRVMDTHVNKMKRVMKHSMASRMHHHSFPPSHEATALLTP
jgi:hypothetical protein